MKTRKVQSASAPHYPTIDSYRQHRRSFLKTAAIGTGLVAAGSFNLLFAMPPPAGGIKPAQEIQLRGDMAVPAKPAKPLIAEPAALTAEQKVEAERLIGQLSSDNFEVRQKATDALVAMGKPVLPVLDKFENHKDLEVRTRVLEIKGKINPKAGDVPAANIRLEGRMSAPEAPAK
jgi:hypothetical protein